MRNIASVHGVYPDGWAITHINGISLWEQPVEFAAALAELRERERIESDFQGEEDGPQH